MLDPDHPQHPQHHHLQQQLPRLEKDPLLMSNGEIIDRYPNFFNQVGNNRKLFKSLNVVNSEQFTPAVKIADEKAAAAVAREAGSVGSSPVAHYDEDPYSPAHFSEPNHAASKF